MNKNRVTLKKLNSKRKVYSFVNIADKNEYSNLAKLLRTQHPKFSIRDTAISQIIRTLSAGLNNLSIDGHYKLSNKIEYTIVRGDIKDFFPSVNKHLLYSKITHSSKISLNAHQTKSIADLLLDPNFKGLPQGLSISSILSEIYLEDFDSEVKLNFPDCTYIRYVDDFLLICPKLIAHQYNFKVEITNILKKYQLTLSKEKFKKLTFTNGTHFLFLGYKFTRQEKQLIVDIDRNKLKKIQKKIVYNFQEYRKSREVDQNKLTRLYFKTANIFFGITTLSPDTLNEQKYGIPFSYKYISSTSSFQLLINNIEYQIHQTPSLKENKSFSRKLKKIYLPFTIPNSNLYFQKLFVNYKYNYLNLSIKKLIQFNTLLDKSFKYNGENTTALLHIFFNKLYKLK